MSRKSQYRIDKNRSIKRVAFLVICLMLVYMYIKFLSGRESKASTPLVQQSQIIETLQTRTSTHHPIEKDVSPNHNRHHLKNATIDKVLVDKSEQQLHLMEDGVIIKSYHVAMGDNPKGHKQQQGDERTPEGNYILDYKNEQSIAYRSIHISYPNEVDRAYAQSLGVDVGGDIMIHGQMNGYGDLAVFNQRRNWTDGCLAVTDDEMDEIMAAVSVGTPIEIVW